MSSSTHCVLYELYALATIASPPGRPSPALYATLTDHTFAYRIPLTPKRNIKGSHYVADILHGSIVKNKIK